jgi:vacuolar-type H+-ATPase subunit I/STV1
VEERERRIGMNEALFREVNERLEELAQGFAHPATLDLICECGIASCARRIEMDRKEYEQVRSDSATFAVVQGHDLPDVEEIVERRKRYDVVRKRAGEAEEIAEKTDPRT